MTIKTRFTKCFALKHPIALALMTPLSRPLTPGSMVRVLQQKYAGERT